MSDKNNDLVGNENEDAFDILNIFNVVIRIRCRRSRKSTSYHNRPRKT
jgi:hypothetical protein